jgi:hypothetical protein
MYSAGVPLIQPINCCIFEDDTGRNMRTWLARRQVRASLSWNATCKFPHSRPTGCRRTHDDASQTCKDARMQRASGVMTAIAAREEEWRGSRCLHLEFVRPW